MLDIFKKEEIKFLNERISELKEENGKLSIQLGKRDEKTRKATASKQIAERELNECEQRHLSLEKEIDSLKKKKDKGVSFRFSGNLFGNRLDEVISILGSIEAKTASLITIYLAGGDKLENVAANVLPEVDSNSLSLIEKIESQTGKAIFYDTNGIVRLVLIPVLPIQHSESVSSRKFEIGILEKSLSCEKCLVLNAHAGETFIGIVEVVKGGGFAEHQVVRSSVMGKHSKGGWSQKRFEKLIEEDIRHHAEKVRNSLSTMLEKHGDIQNVIAGGDGKLVSMILEGCEFDVIMKSLAPVGKGNVDQVMRDVMAVRWYGV